MLYQNFKFAFRHISGNKIYAALNVTGLMLGLAISLIIYLIIYQELSFDRYHQNIRNIYQVMKYEKKETGSSISPDISIQASNSLVSEIPEFERITRIPSEPATSLMINDHSLNESGIYADPDIFRVFSFDLIKGDPETVLESVNNIIISESIAAKYFPDQDPIGKVINTQGNSGQIFTISGILREIPVKSSLQFDYIIPWKNYISLHPTAEDNKSKDLVNIYVKLNPGSSPSAVSSKIATLAPDSDIKENNELFLFPFSKIHVSPVRYKDASGGGMIGAVVGLTILGFLILFVACVNYTSLSTSLYLKRAKETGVKKIFGSTRFRLSFQFLLESLIISFIAMILGLILANLIIPWFNSSFNWNLQVIYTDHVMIAGLFAILFITTLLSGIYPAFYLSKLSPLQILKGSDTKGRKNATLRKVLVITQFFFASFLIILSVAFIKQISYIKNRDLGVKIDDMIIFDMNQNLRRYSRNIKDEMTRLASVEYVSFTSQNPLMVRSETTDVDYDGKGESEGPAFMFISVDGDFIKSMALPVTYGRDFDKSLISDSANFILNEKAAKILGGKTAVGSKLRLGQTVGMVIGVTKDYHMTHMNFPIKPMIFSYGNYPYSMGIVKFKTGMTVAGTNDVIKIIEKFDKDPGRHFITMKDAFENIYADNVFRTGKLTIIFSLLALWISCLGLISLSMYNAEMRTKEIGIHRVHGADLLRIIIMLTREYVLWISVSLILAIPAGFLVLNKLFSRTAYHTRLSFWIFVLAGAVVLIIALGTVGWQAFRSASRNPSETLKYE